VRAAVLLPAAALLAAAGLGACAKNPTQILVAVSADSSVPPLLLLRTTVARASNPDERVSSSVRSLSENSDAANRPGPFPFPIQIPVGVDPSFAGPVTVTIEGLDWDTQAVLATGVASTEVVPDRQTAAAITLTAAPAGAGDGGADAGADAGAMDGP
jgi:hypothetical protein